MSKESNWEYTIETKHTSVGWQVDNTLISVVHIYGGGKSSLSFILPNSAMVF